MFRKSILLRKYGYLFYRKTISQILPSQARELYVKQLRRNIFNRWMVSLYHEKATWKLIVRANLHHVYASKRKAFKKWKLFLINSTIVKLQNDLAVKHCDKKIKIKYFVMLQHARKVLVCKNKLVNILFERLVIGVYFLDLIVLNCRSVDSTKNYIVKKYAIEKWKSNNLKQYFQKLLIYANHKISKHNAELKARIFFKKKHLEFLRSFLKTWLKYSTSCITKRIKYKNASNLFRNKILRDALNKFLIYKEHKFINRTKLFSALQTHEVRLKRNYFKKWLRFVKNSLVKSTQIENVDDHYRKKIMRSKLHVLVKYKDYKQIKRGMLRFVDYRFNVKLTSKHFIFLRKYCDHKRTKKAQTTLALTQYSNKLVRKYFALVLKYYNERAQKKRQNAYVIKNTFLRSKTIVKKHHFYKWKLFTSMRKEDVLKESLAIAKYGKLLITTSFDVWKRFVEQKRLKVKVKELQRKKILFRKWHDFAVKAREYTNKRELAQKIYKDTLIKKGLSVIFKACYEKQQLVQSVLLKRIERNFFLALKYYKIWKYKVFQSRIYSTGDVTNIGKSITETQLPWITDLRLDGYIKSVDFKWDDACLEKPRIPHFLRDSLKDIFA